MPTPQSGMRSEDLAPLVLRLLEAEPDFVGKQRGGGLCCYCHAGLGDDEAPARLFAVAADGGLLLRLAPDRQESVVERGVAVSNAALPQWVLEPLADGMRPRTHRPDPEVHGTPGEWVWLPVHDVAAFERRRGHLLEALAFGRHLAAFPDARRR